MTINNVQDRTLKEAKNFSKFHLCSKNTKMSL